jgi:hypothetical protein
VSDRVSVCMTEVAPLTYAVATHAHPANCDGDFLYAVPGNNWFWTSVRWEGRDVLLFGQDEPCDTHAVLKVDRYRPAEKPYALLQCHHCDASSWSVPL